MTEFKGFKTKKEAEYFIKENGGGLLVWEERKRNRLTDRGRYYLMAVEYGGLDKELYPYCVQWNVRLL